MTAEEVLEKRSVFAGECTQGEDVIRITDAVELMKLYAVLVANKALQDACINAKGYIKGHSIKIDKQSIMLTKIELP